MSTEIKIDLEKPPEVIEIKYGNPVSVIDHLCPEHMKSFVIKNADNTFRFRHQPVASINGAEKGKTCRICSYTRSIPKP